MQKLLLLIWASVVSITGCVFFQPVSSDPTPEAKMEAQRQDARKQTEQQNSKISPPQEENISQDSFKRREKIYAEPLPKPPKKTDGDENSVEPVIIDTQESPEAQTKPTAISDPTKPIEEVMVEFISDNPAASLERKGDPSKEPAKESAKEPTKEPAKEKSTSSPQEEPPDVEIVIE